tara:strand:- start:3067 stop:3651 length:585 start_codon:yes stop_codon:yes gene_type:complete
MSTKEEVGADTRARRLLERTNPLIVLQGQGITGDQLPSNLFSQDDFDQEKRNLFINLDNYEVINTLNAIGHITGTQSSSGPLVNTMSLKSTGRVVSSTTTTLFKPDPGQVWVMTGAQLDASAGSGSVTTVLHYTDSNSAEVRIEAASTAGIAEFNITSTAGPLYVSNEVFLQITSSSVGAGEEFIVTGAFVRVR